MGKEMGMKVAWQYIVFDYNIDTLEEAKEIAKRKRIDMLVLNSIRTENDYDMKHKEKYEKFIPKCIENHRRQLANSTSGYMTPCCWTNTQYDDPEYADIFDEEIHLSSGKSIKEIVTSDQWVNFYSKLKADGADVPKRCRNFCTIDVKKDPEGTETWFKYDTDIKKNLKEWG